MFRKWFYDILKGSQDEALLSGDISPALSGFRPPRTLARLNEDDAKFHPRSEDKIISAARSIS